MVWYAWWLVATQILSILGTVYLIGRPRKSVSHGEAVYAIIYGALAVWAILALAGVL